MHLSYVFLGLTHRYIKGLKLFLSVPVNVHVLNTAEQWHFEYISYTRWFYSTYIKSIINGLVQERHNSSV